MSGPKLEHDALPWRVEYEEPFCPVLLNSAGDRVRGVKLWEDDADGPGVGLNDTPRANFKLLEALGPLINACRATIAAEDYDTIEAAKESAREALKLAGLL